MTTRTGKGSHKAPLQTTGAAADALLGAARAAARRTSRAAHSRHEDAGRRGGTRAARFGASLVMTALSGTLSYSVTRYCTRNARQCTATRGGGSPPLNSRDVASIAHQLQYSCPPQCLWPCCPADRVPVPHAVTGHVWSELSDHQQRPHYEDLLSSNDSTPAH